jgi:hypothetical protein
MRIHSIAGGDKGLQVDPLQYAVSALAVDAAGAETGTL